MSLSRSYGEVEMVRDRGTRSHSAQGLATYISSPAMKIPLPPRMWLTDMEDDSSDDISGSVRDEGVVVDRPRVRSRFRHHKSRSAPVPIGIFWDIENCQVPRGCSPIDVVSAIRAKFLPGRREADFVVVCDVRKEAAYVLQELNDAQVSLIHVCGTQKNAADEKLRQCMRRFAELHSAPAALLLISGDINFASDLSDFRHRKNMDVILMHKQNTSSALIACASSHYCYNQLTANLPRTSKAYFLNRYNEEDEDQRCELEVSNLPEDSPPENVSRRLRRLADNCGGKVIRVNGSTAVLRFPSPDFCLRALKRMDGEDVFGRKIMTRYARSSVQPAYSSDEGYSTAPPQPPARPAYHCPGHQAQQQKGSDKAANDWARALQHLPAPTPPPLEFGPTHGTVPRKIRGTHGSANLDRSGCSSSNSGDDGRPRAASPWNSSASFSEQSDVDETSAELTVSNLPPFDPPVLQEMLRRLFSQWAVVLRVSVWGGGEGPAGCVALRSEAEARVCIARVHKRRLDAAWAGRRLELALGRPAPAPSLDVLRARLRAILLDQPDRALPLLRLRDAYASRHCCALTAADIAKVKDVVVVHEGYGRMVQLLDLTPVTPAEMEEAPWKCRAHAALPAAHEDGSRILQPVYMEVELLARHVRQLLDSHGGILPLLSFVECYEAQFPPLIADPRRGVPLELLLRSVEGVEVKDAPSRHLTWRTEVNDSPSSNNSSQSVCSRSSGDRDKPRTAPALEPMLALFERELTDLLRTAPGCAIPFSKLIPAFHHHFGRQCRVADYGFTKLPDLLAALSNTIVVLGSGSYRMITISAAAQSRRWTSDLVKLLKAQPGRTIHQNDIPHLYFVTFSREFTPVDYGVCTLKELMSRVSPSAVIVNGDGSLALPRREPTPEERARTHEFAMQTVELLYYTPNLRMEFSRFVPAYHAHFGRQLRVAHYGCVKLAEVFDMIPETVRVEAGGAERAVRLRVRLARPIVAQRLRALGAPPLAALSDLYAAQYGAPPDPAMLDAASLEELVYAAGGCVERGGVAAPGRASRWAAAALGACAALSADRSVARGSTLEYFAAAFRRLCGAAPDVARLAAARVLRVEEGCVRLTPEWRTVWRLARLLADRAAPLTAMEIYLEYSQRYEPVFPGASSGLDGVAEFLRQYTEIFFDSGCGKYTLCAGVVVPQMKELPVVHEDYSIHDTPPGQKGSRVFESPKKNIWCSPPASALPTPTALLTQEKRRTRLAAQFDAS